MLFRSILRPLTILAAFIGLGAYATVMMRGPQGLGALADKRHEVRVLEEENANLAHEIKLKKERIEKLNTDKNTQELEVRKRLQMQRPGDTTFVISGQDRTEPADRSDKKH